MVKDVPRDNDEPVIIPQSSPPITTVVPDDKIAPVVPDVKKKKKNNRKRKDPETWFRRVKLTENEDELMIDYGKMMEPIIELFNSLLPPGWPRIYLFTITYLCRAIGPGRVRSFTRASCLRSSSVLIALAKSPWGGPERH